MPRGPEERFEIAGMSICQLHLSEVAQLKNYETKFVSEACPFHFFSSFSDNLVHNILRLGVIFMNLEVSGHYCLT